MITGFLGGVNITAILNLWEGKNWYLVLTIATWGITAAGAYPVLLIADNSKFFRDWYPTLYEYLPARWTPSYFLIS